MPNKLQEHFPMIRDRKEQYQRALPSPVMLFPDSAALAILPTCSCACTHQVIAKQVRNKEKMILIIGNIRS